MQLYNEKFFVKLYDFFYHLMSFLILLTNSLDSLTKV
jgi:hypothetical protein